MSSKHNRTHAIVPVYVTIDISRENNITVSEACSKAMSLADQEYNGQHAGMWHLSKSWADKDYFHITFEAQHDYSHSR